MPLGQIGTRDHEVGIHIDMTPMRVRIPGVKEDFVVSVASPRDDDGNAIYEFAHPDQSAWTPGAIGGALQGIPFFGFWVRPREATPGPRPNPARTPVLANPSRPR